VKKNTATRINCGKGSHSTSTTTYILETIYSTSGNDSRHGNNVGALAQSASATYGVIGYDTMVSSSETERVWGGGLPKTNEFLRYSPCR